MKTMESGEIDGVASTAETQSEANSYLDEVLAKQNRGEL